MFKNNNQPSFPQREESILQFWEEKGVFALSLEATKKGKSFAFYDGPPFATGRPHYGHILSGTIKDVIPRFWTMKGYYVPRVFGWDCHGLPVENEIEKAQELSGSSAIEKFGIARFSEECRRGVLRYTEEWEKTMLRMGRWVDFRKAYKTMDKSFMESVWWVFSELYQKGLIYEGFKVMPFSTKLGTPLSNFEANLNYQEVDDPSVVIAFPLEEEPKVTLIAWTTTPWTLPSNLALAVHPTFDYVEIEDLESSRRYILAEARVKEYFKNYNILRKFKGKTLQGKRYLPIFSYFSNRKNEGKSFSILIDEFVTVEEGTGVVHMAPAFGEADFFICQREGIELVCPIDANGRFTEEVSDYHGLFVKDADKEILRHLKSKGAVISHKQIRHRYPFCWRSDTPLIYKAVQTWFVAVETFKEQLLKANEQIHWVPEHIKWGRFGKWLEQARDWAISRNRYWGTPIPIWRSDAGDIRIMGSVKELEEKIGRTIPDLHRPFIDDTSFVERGQLFRRIPEVFDCWFESGSMPYAQHHFPFENRDQTIASCPADFVGEGLDQTRGWFYTLNVISVALFDQPAFRNVIVNGIILAQDGAKMSKRLKNYPEPLDVIQRYGADAIRLYLLNSSALIGDDLRFSAKGVELVLRQFLITFWNAYLFLATYANIYHWKPKRIPNTPGLDLDRWILSLLQKLIYDVTEKMEGYQLQATTSSLVAFMEHLTNWYIRRSRSRFWSDQATSERQEAFETLYTVLHTLTRLTAPFIPFLSEAIYLELRTPEEPISVHLLSFPLYQPEQRDEELETEMSAVHQVVNMGHALRKENQKRVRQPLATAYLVSADRQKLQALKKHHQLIKEELNVKEVIFDDDDDSFVTIHLKPNFKTLGKKVGPLMKTLQQTIEELPTSMVKTFQRDKTLSVRVNDEEIPLSLEDVIIERQIKEGTVAAVKDQVTLAFNMTLDDSLILEGIARDLVNKINTMRRELKFEVTDRIHVTLHTTPYIKKAFQLHHDYISQEVLALNFSFESEEKNLKQEGRSWVIEDHPIMILLQKSTHQ